MPASDRCTCLPFSSTQKSPSPSSTSCLTRFGTTRLTRMYSSGESSAGPEMISGAALVAVGLGQRHVVAQVVETEFVVGAVGDVRGIGFALVAVRHARVHHAHAQAQPVVQLAHLRGIAAGQVVVHGDHVHALAFQRVEVHRQGRYQGLAFTGAHFCDLAQVKHHAADQLHVVVAHAQHAAARFAADRERFRQHLVQGFAAGDALLELRPGAAVVR
ncbi:hypothetical protein G6F68_012927 [Rhizopus microsporus]|nr:hypothetical protein G6F68_012927 [Rhizopus microsporus]